MDKKIVLFVYIFSHLHGNALSSNSNEVLRGCSVGSNKKGSVRNNLTLEEIHHNNAKNNEFFRISLIFPWKKPVIGISSTKSSLNYYFGMFVSSFVLSLMISIDFR